MIKTTSLIPVLALLSFAVQAQDANIAADPNRMKARIDALGEFGKNPQGGVSRIPLGARPPGAGIPREVVRLPTPPRDHWVNVSGQLQGNTCHSKASFLVYAY